MNSSLESGPSHRSEKLKQKPLFPDTFCMTFGRMIKIMASVCLAAFLIAGCGGGGGGSDSGSGSGIGNGLGGTGVDASLRVVFPAPQSLSLGLVADSTLSDLQRYERSGTFSFQPSASLSMTERQDESQRYYAISSTIKRQIAYYRVVVSGPDMQTVSAEFPSSQTFAIIRVPSGNGRTIVIKALNTSREELLSTAPIVLNLDPASTRELVGQGGAGSGEGTVPVEFVLVDNIAPVTVIYASNGNTVEGPHRSAVDIVLSNNETDARLFYKVSEDGKPASSLIAVTSDYVQTQTTTTISLNQEAVYFFEFYSIDAQGNQESLQQKLITVNFNLNPPVTQLDYPGAPYKFFTAATVGLSVAMQTGQTGVISYQVDGGNQLKSTSLKHLEETRVTIGDGRVLSTPSVLSFQAAVTNGSEELSPRTTEFVLTDISVGGSVKVTFTGSAQSFVSTGRVPFCDTDATSYLVNADQCQSKGKLLIFKAGRASVGMGADFDCFRSVSSVISVTSSGSCKPCNQPGVDCPN